MAKRERKGLGLLAKLILFSLVPAYFFVGVIIYFYNRDLKEAITQKYVEEALVAASVIQRKIPHEEFSRNAEQAMKSVKEVFEINPNFLKVRIYSEYQGKVSIRASTQKSDIGKEAEIHAVRAIFSGESIVVENQDPISPVVEVFAPYLEEGKVVGGIGITFSSVPRDTLVGHLYARVLWIVLPGCALILMAVFLVVHRILLIRLSALAGGAEMLSQGELGHRLQVRGRDEVSHLTESFNTMAGSLQGLMAQVENKSEALAVSKQRLEGILDTARDSIVSTDEYQRIVLFNQGAEVMFGYSAEEVMGRGVTMLVPERFREVHPHHVAEFGKSGIRARRMGERRQVYGLRKDGTEFPAEATISRVDMKDEKIFTVIMRDITELIEAENTLKRQTDELARSNAELQQFASVASHDLQEPLRMVASYTQLLAKRYQGKLDADADEFIGYAVEGATRMQRLISDLLIYSRVGEGDKRSESTDCNVVLKETLANLKKSVEEVDATVTSDPLPSLMADPTQLGQLFQNLTENAIKYHGSRPVEVHVSAERKKDHWLFSVRDNGIGIHPDYAERIFSVFQRLHTQKEYPGTGIGLAICKRIVERHNGKIWVESEPYKGSTFYFTLPSA